MDVIWRFIWILILICCVIQTQATVVADSVTHIPLPNASVYSNSGKAVGVSNGKGILPRISQENYPITIRYIGFNDKIVRHENQDTVFLSENISELPEVVVQSRRERLLHVLAYVREYSTLSNYTDTVFLFREKMVDYMLPSDDKMKFKGWTNPRVLTSKSYYRFTNDIGLDSVSDVSRHHFSWSDWIGMVPKVALPAVIRNTEIGTDTVYGKYSPTEIWLRNKDSVSVNVDVLADITSRKWVPDLAGFFRKDLDFERFRLKYIYDNIAGDTLSAIDLTGYSFNIESNGRGHSMFRFNRINEPFFVSTSADVYILDKEHITVKEAKKWENRRFDTEETGIYEPLEAPALSTSILALIDRVSNIDKESIRLDTEPDRRMIKKFDGRRNFKIGRRALSLLKGLTGITAYKSRKNFNNNWSKFRKEQIQKNKKQERTPADTE